ncbi:MAG: hypothetical protein ACRDO1_16005 [Nocardioidaceae bacterium]
MRSRTIAVWAGVIGGVGLLAKMVVMAIQGRPEPTTSVPENIAFFVGIIGLAIAASASGAYLTRRRAVIWRVLAAIAAVVVVAAALGIGQTLLMALPGDSWWQEEAIFGVLGLVALAAATSAAGSHRRRVAASQPT